MQHPKVLYANGCSMAFGAELGDPLRTSFPALVANALGLELVNDAYSGRSNCGILRSSLMWISRYLKDGGNPQELFVLIGWTGVDRREFGLSEAEDAPDPNHFWRNLHMHRQLADATPDHIQLRKVLVRAFWNDRESMTRFLVAANALQGVLSSHKIGYCFAHAIGVCGVHQELDALTHALAGDHFFRFLDAQGDFLTLNRDVWKAPVGTHKHPLEEAHALWAGLLVDYIGEKKLL